MSDLLDPTDPAAVEAVLTRAVQVLGRPGTLDQLALVPGLSVRPARPGGLFRAAQPAVVAAGDRALRWPADGPPELDHVVGAVVLASDPVAPRALPGILAALVVRAVTAAGTADEACVALTALRDALASAH